MAHELVGIYAHVRFDTGMAPGDIRFDALDRRLVGNSSWQYDPAEDYDDTAEHEDKAREVWLVRSGDPAAFEGVDGLEILYGAKAIDDRLNDPAEGFARPADYSVWSEELLALWLEQSGADLSAIPRATGRARYLYELGAVGVARTPGRKPQRARDVARAAGILHEDTITP